MVRKLVSTRAAVCLAYIGRLSVLASRRGLSFSVFLDAAVSICASRGGTFEAHLVPGGNRALQGKGEVCRGTVLEYPLRQRGVERIDGAGRVLRDPEDP